MIDLRSTATIDIYATDPHGSCVFVDVCVSNDADILKRLTARIIASTQRQEAGRRPPIQELMEKFVSGLLSYSSKPKPC